MNLYGIEIDLKEVSDEELDAIAGGIQPQPLPPGIVFSSALRLDVLLIQPQPILLGGIVIGSRSIAIAS